MNQFAEDEFLGALDFSKAYDFMAPKKSQEIMIAAGIPPAVARLFGEHWMQQVRLVKFDNHLSKEELRTTTAHPQGGPWGPVIIQLWMIAGTLWTKSQFDKKNAELVATAGAFDFGAGACEKKTEVCNSFARSGDPKTKVGR